MDKILILYFSGTGNSKYLAEIFAIEMNAACHSIEEEINFKELITNHDTIAFSFPTYGSRVPRILRDFTGKYARLIYRKKLILFCNQMAFSGDGARAFTYIYPLKYRKNLNVVYAEHFIMPNNVGNVFITPLASKKKTRRYFARAKLKMENACDEIKAGIILKRGFNPISRGLGLLQGTIMPILELMARDSIYVRENCTGCGLCVKKCPMKNLTNENGKISGKGNCIICYRCVNLCPEKCITAFFHAEVKNQYRGKD
ncbi:MAG: EFR1 family ferrodoxin [Lachnospiraceae bacterium]|nr:EFR1 family ferrodoxin [Lachnospiraceae bacterium]